MDEWVSVSEQVSEWGTEGRKKELRENGRERSQKGIREHLNNFSKENYQRDVWNQNRRQNINISNFCHSISFRGKEFSACSQHQLKYFDISAKLPFRPQCHVKTNKYM